MAAENEEFEFRLRAEREAKAPAAPSGDKSDLIPQTYAKPVKEESPSYITPSEVAMGPLGLVKAGGRAAGRGLETILNTDVKLPFLGRGNLGQELQGLGPAESFGPRAATKIPGVSRTMEPALPRASKPATVAPKAGEGAESAVNELQRQRNVAAGTEKPADLAGQSAHEAAVLERDKVTTPLRQAAFRGGERVDAAPVLSLIGELEAKNPDKGVRSALKDVRDVIGNATKGSQGKSLPAAGARVTPAELKKMQGQANSMDTAMADEVRQSINRLLEKTGDGALDGHTKQVLGQIKDKLVEGAPEGYRKYLSEYTRLSEPLEQFKAAGGARDKVTTDAKAFSLLNPADKQNMIQAAFKSDTPGRALSELVRDTAHSPEAAQGVRAAYTDWLTQIDDTVKMQPSMGGLTKRWEQTRDAVRSSKLMDADHMASMDKIMDDLRDAGQKHGLKKLAASVAGWFAGSQVGHPFVAARGARELLGSGQEAATKAINNAVMQIAADPAGAKALAAPPTPANVAKIREMLPTDIAAALAPVAAREEQRTKRSDPLSMQPRF